MRAVKCKRDCRCVGGTLDQIDGQKYFLLLLLILINAQYGLNHVHVHLNKKINKNAAPFLSSIAIWSQNERSVQKEKSTLNVVYSETLGNAQQLY